MVNLEFFFLDKTQKPRKGRTGFSVSFQEKECHSLLSFESDFFFPTLGLWLRSLSTKSREAPVRFGHGLEMERFKRFRFSVPAVPLQKGFFCISVECNRKGRFRFRFRFLENGSGGSGSAFGFGKNDSDGSGFRFRFGS